jgi:CDP-diglyceride synthetase
MLPFLIAFVALTPDFTTILVTNQTALSRFLRQVVTNGFPVVFIVNYIGFFVSSGLLQKVNRSALRRIFSDTFARAGAFVVLHVLIYVFSADWFGSFGGDRWTALRVVGPTLVRSYLFENISGVYLYALLPGIVITYWPEMPNPEGTNDSPFATRRTIVIIGACLCLVVLVTVLSIGLTQLFGPY